MRTGSGWRGHPRRQLARESGQGQGAVAEDGIVERPQVERRAVPLLDLGPQALDLALADPVGEGLARPADVAVRFDHRIRLAEAGAAQEVDRALARPAQGVEAGVDHQSGCPPGHRVELPETLALIPEEAHLV